MCSVLGKKQTQKEPQNKRGSDERGTSAGPEQQNLTHRKPYKALGKSKWLRTSNRLFVSGWRKGNSRSHTTTCIPLNFNICMKALWALSINANTQKIKSFLMWHFRSKGFDLLLMHSPDNFLAFYFLIQLNHMVNFIPGIFTVRISLWFRTK